MIFSLDVRRARKGDCLLLHFGSRDKPGLVMIDGGPKGVYGPHLKPRIQAIRKARGLDENRPMPVDLLMVSHVDDDHIQGILDLTREMIAIGKGGAQPVQVLNFWHNSFDNIIGNEPGQLTAAFKHQFGEASTSGAPPADITVDADDETLDEKVVVANLKVLASIEQGARLRGEADALGFPLNLEFNGELVMAEATTKPLDIAPGLKFTVAGPMLPELKKLHKKHEAWLVDLKKKGKSPSEALAAYVDTSVPNLSSIVVLAEAANKRMLLTGDARGDKILKGLELVGLMKNGKMHVDLLKVPHHGSDKNVELAFFKRITADHYVFSGDGEHGNPERETLQMLLEARGDANYMIHLTYPVEEIDIAREEDWKKEQTKERNRKKKKPTQKVRANWSPKKHSLAALFTQQTGLAKKVTIVGVDKPHVIDLGEALGNAWPSLVA